MILALALVVFIGYIGAKLRFANTTNRVPTQIEVGSVLWRQLDVASDTSELLIDGVCVAQGSIELYMDNNVILGVCGKESEWRIFSIDLSSKRNQLDWYDDIIQCPRHIRKTIDFARMSTFEDFKKR